MSRKTTKSCKLLVTFYGCRQLPHQSLPERVVMVMLSVVVVYMVVMVMVVDGIMQILLLN